MKKTSLLIAILICFCFAGKAQECYSDLIAKAKECNQNKKDSLQLKKALLLYEKAYDNYSDSINDRTLYNASLLANDLMNFDIAFKFLKPLSELIEDEEGYPGWDYIIGEYAKDDYKNLLNHPRWKYLEKKAIIKQKTFFEELYSSEKEFFDVNKVEYPKNLSAAKIYNHIKESNPYKNKLKQDYSLSLKINDTLTSSYFVHLPKNYNPEKEYSALLFLHGAVHYNTFSKFQTKSNLKYWNRFYTKYSNENDVILIFPQGNKEYNWMTSDKGFFMIPKIIRQLKRAINIDNNKIFISGHSNGATGSFSYLMKDPTLFAGFFGFNTQPKVFTGGTFIENIKNRSFINFSTDQDYYYPVEANDSLSNLCRRINADYKDYRYNGFPHWFPEFDESEPAYKIIFDDINSRSRNPFPEELNWEIDDENNGNIDWLNDIKLDTLGQNKVWHKNLNFKITKWLEYNDSDSLIVKNVNKTAFNLPNKSGKIITKYQHNEFHFTTSNIMSFKLYISPEMVNLKKKIKVFVNGKLHFNQKITYDKEFMLKSFKNNGDREQIWVNNIKITL